MSEVVSDMYRVAPAQKVAMHALAEDVLCYSYNNNVIHFLSATIYTFLCADVSVGNVFRRSLVSEGGHCQGACRLPMFFYIPLWRWDRHFKWSSEPQWLVGLDQM